MMESKVHRDHPQLLQLLDAVNYADTLTQCEDEIIRQARRLNIVPHFPNPYAAAELPTEQVYAALIEEHLGRNGYSWHAAKLFLKVPNVRIDLLIHSQHLASRVLKTAKCIHQVEITDWEDRVTQQLAANFLQIGFCENKFFGKCWMDHELKMETANA